MSAKNRREFLSDSARNLMVGTLGAGIIAELQLDSAFGKGSNAAVDFGDLEPLVAALQETPINKLQPMLVNKINSGTKLKTLIAAGSLANARAFGGEDYIGFHTMMALAPAWHMAQALPKKERALPVLKVLYRNTKRMHETGGRRVEKLKPVDSIALPESTPLGPFLRDAVRSANTARAEEAFAALKGLSQEKAWNALLYALYDQPGVHKVVQAWRTWDMHHMAGEEHAHTLLRASIRHLTRDERNRIQYKRPAMSIRELLPKLFDHHGFEKRKPGTKHGDDQWLTELSDTIFGGSREQAANAAAEALASGYRLEDVSEACSIAANRLLLQDPGRREARGEDKPIGSVHGDSVGVHASDSANAWRNIALASNTRNQFASLIVAAYHTAGQSQRVKSEVWPKAEDRARFTSTDPKRLLAEADECIRNKDQGGACAAIQQYGDAGHSARPVFDLLLRFATSEEGALHAEKYFRTVTEEFAAIRPSFRWRQLVALARVSASECGNSAAGSQQARELLGLS